MDLVSVIIPYYKKKNSILKTVNSVLNQSYKKNELVMEILNFLEKDKKSPICTPFSK